MDDLYPETNDTTVALADDTRAMILFYFLSQDKPEFAEFAQELADKFYKKEVLVMAWCLSSDYKPKRHTEAGDEFNALVVFVKDYGQRNGLTMIEWLKSIM